jgi:hypothetical protein
MGEYTGVVVLLAFVFVAGWGWGQWWAERAIRAERAAQDKGRISVSMPMKPEDAAATMGLLKDLMQRVEHETGGTAHAR